MYRRHTCRISKICTFYYWCGVVPKATYELGMAMMKQIIQHSQFPLRGVLPQRGPILPWMSEPFPISVNNRRSYSSQVNVKFNKCLGKHVQEPLEIKIALFVRNIVR